MVDTEVLEAVAGAEADSEGLVALEAGAGSVSEEAGACAEVDACTELDACAVLGADAGPVSVELEAAACVEADA